jgi:adenosylhomocysteine nucleosidase
MWDNRAPAVPGVTVLAIVSAMSEEIAGVIGALTAVKTREFGRREFHTGLLHGAEVVVVFSRYGKVAAAATVAQLLSAYPVTELIFSGVAGGARHGLSIGDIVIGSELIQHDMDASPLFPRYEVPLLGKARFAADAALGEELAQAAKQFLEQDLHDTVAGSEIEFFRLTQPKVLRGLIASGDKFFASAGEIEDLRRRIPDVSCVEMEGAAVAQVCDEYAVPFGVVRTISDSADETAVLDFPRFAREIARHYSVGVLSRFLQSR